MPGRLRQSSSRAAAAVAEEVQHGPYNVPGLDFNEPLTWKAGKAIPVADLFSRLQKLGKELRAIEQDTIEVADITKLAQDLVHPNLLGHKDKGIRAWTVCCVVDILNICAPNAPYKNEQLRDIFTVIINSILPALADSSNAYHAQHQYILFQLVDAKSIVLVTDLQDAEPLLTSLFTVCFDIVSGSGKNASGVEIAKNVEYQLGSLLTIVVDEAILPPDVIDTIISQFLRVDPRSVPQPQTKKKTAEAKDKSQSTLLLKDYPSAYNMAKVICTSCSDKMSGAISQYYGTIVSNASSAMTAEDGKGRTLQRALSPGSDDEDEDRQALNDLRKVHRLIKELWRACPDVLVGVIPQCEIELAADSIYLRSLATETLGDLMAGVGLAGLPDLPELDPAAFPLPRIDVTDNRPLSTNPLLNPMSPKPFMHVHASTYQAFLGRRIDKAASVRIAWTKAVSRVLVTGAGGIGMSEEEKATLVAGLARMLKDVDEKVRLIALQSLKPFPYHAVIRILGSDGGLAQPTSLLSVVAERVVDKKLPVREQAMLLLGNMWGVASRDIADGNEEVRSVIGQAPTKLLTAMYVKDSHVSMLLLKVLYECLLPLSYPPAKAKIVSSQGDGGDIMDEPDTLRVRRLLTLVRDLDEKAKPVFFGMQKRQADMTKAITTFLKYCEDYNGGVTEDFSEAKQLEEQLSRFIEILAKQQFDPSKFSSDLLKFAKAHDRRSYQLIRFAMGPEHDFRTVTKAIKEFNKRIRDSTSTTEAMLESLIPLLYQCALVSYNRSHLPAIIEFSRSQDASLSDTAQELLREISEKVPEVMKSHIKVLCTELETTAPTDKKQELASAGDSLKACAAFAKKFPEEIPKDRNFEIALMHFIEHSASPKAAKHATTIVLKISTKKELRAKEIVSKAVKKCASGAANKLAQLAAIAQVCLLAPQAASAVEDSILGIVTKALQTNSGSDEEEEEENLSAWSDTVDEETTAKVLALRILVNRCRSGNEKDRESFDTLANSVIDILMKLIRNNGEITTSKNTPNVQRNHLRLASARSLIKLAHHKLRCEELISAEMFEIIGQIMINPPYAVRRGVLAQIKKYLNTNSLNGRWYTIFFLTAFEVDPEIRSSTFGWLKSRAAFFTRQQQSRNNDKKVPTNIMEITFARLLSLLAHHPDYPPKDISTYEADLLDFAKYIIYYLQAVATDDNLSLIFHIAQRVKQAQDALSKDLDVQERLYVLSDLAQATIRNFADLMPAHARGMNLLQTWPGKAHLPNALFSPINGHVRAQEIAAKNYLPEDVALGLETLVRQVVRNTKSRENKAKHRTPVAERKRKSSVSVDLDDDDDDAENQEKSNKKKRSKSSSLPIRRTPIVKKRKSEILSVEQPSRKSARTSKVKSVNYVESEDEDEEENDADDIVKYNPAPLSKKSNQKTKEQTPDIAEGSDDEEDEREEDEADVGSPTPHGRNAEEVDGGAEEEAAAEQEDTEMTDNNEEEEEQVANEDEEMATDENVQEAEDEQNGTEEDAEGAEELETTPKSKSDRRTTRARNTATATSKKPKQPAKAKAVQKPTTKAQAKTTNEAGSPPRSSKGKTAVGKKAVASSSPVAPEPSRRSSRRAKA